jgi:glycosyltransferase involved in cell wall biosynthesis
MQHLVKKAVYYLPSIFSYVASENSNHNLEPAKEGIILWVGSNTARKRPNIFVEMAHRFPKMNFIMIFSPGDGTGGIDVESRPENLEFVASCPREKLRYYYKKSLLLLSTSKLEGFPNVFLESWWFKRPVLSLDVDPDGVIAKHQLGKVVFDIESLAKELENLCANKKLRETFGENGYRYVKENHSSEKVANQFLQYVTAQM